MKFSQKIGKTPIREIIQVESIDKRLENRLWNNILENFFAKLSTYADSELTSDKENVCKFLWKDFFENRIDEIPSIEFGRKGINISRVIDYIKDWFFDSEWFEKYDLIELISKLDNHQFKFNVQEKFNQSLKFEMAGYRIIKGAVVRITSEEEILEIEQALSNSSKWKPVETHLKASIEYFSNRETPDYRNSIKESISSIESLCIIITNNPKATLGQALSIIEKKYKIHGALKGAFSSLYGYTSDSGGIRHALLEGDEPVTFEDAKFLLVSCSAFINYLKVKIEK